jgi:hypothetical protein
MNNGKRSLWLELFLVILTPIIGMALGVGITMAFGLNQTDYSNLIVNLFLIAAGIILVRIFKFSKGDLGLKLIEGQLKWHVIPIFDDFYSLCTVLHLCHPYFSAETLLSQHTLGLAHLSHRSHRRRALLSWCTLSFFRETLFSKNGACRHVTGIWIVSCSTRILRHNFEDDNGLAVGQYSLLDRDDIPAHLSHSFYVQRNLAVGRRQLEQSAYLGHIYTTPY